MSSTFIIVGGSLAGARAAATLRAEGFEGTIVLVGAETEPPYERPPLSKEVLRGEMGREKLLLHPETYWTEQRIDLRLGRRVLALSVRDKTVALDDGAILHYDKILLATGAEVRRLGIPGEDLSGVSYLRTLQEAATLGEALRRKPKVLVLGAGFIGCEVAASARSLGCEVVMIDIATPLSRVLGEKMGRIYAELHRAHGVDLRIGESITEFRGNGRLEGAMTSSGTSIACDAAVIGVGVLPAVEFLAGQPVTLDNGIRVDEFCRTNVPDIFAAGDVASWWHPGYQEHLRVEHFDNAQMQGIAAARSMLDKGQPYAPLPSFWSDQYDWHLQSAGHFSSYESMALRGKPEEGAFSAFYLKGGKIRACVAVNRVKDLSAAKRLIAADRAVTIEQLADESVDLKQLAAAPPTA